MGKPKAYIPITTGTSVERDIRDRFADVINVKDFGAKGDGVTDDTSAIQAAIAYLETSSREGKVIFPYGRYIISDTITVKDNASGRVIIDLCGSSVAWNGAQDGLMFDITGNSNGICNGSIQGAMSASTDPSAVAGVCLRLRTYWAFAQNISINFFRISGIDLGGDGTFDGVTMASSLCASLININISNSITTLPWAGSGGATGIRVYGYDNKFEQVTVLRCRNCIRLYSGGNRFTNCHFCEMQNSSQEEMPGNNGSVAVRLSSGDNKLGVNSFVTCYFDNVTYVFYGDNNSKITNVLENCFYWSYQSTASDKVSYMLGGTPNPIVCHNFTDATGYSSCRFMGAVGSVSIGAHKREYFDEHYTRPAGTKNTSNWVPYMARYKVDDFQKVKVCLDQSLSPNSFYLIGGLLFPNRYDVNYSYVDLHFKVGFINGSLGGGEIEAQYSAYTNTWQFDEKSLVPSRLFGLQIGTVKSITIRNTNSFFIPIYIYVLPTASATTSNEVSAWMQSYGCDTGLYLIPAEQTSRPFTDTTSNYIRRTDFTQLS